MNNKVYIFEVSEQSFNESVLQNSFALPVLVEFMGVWSEPCIMMSDNLARLAEEFSGQFVFAKVDVDEQQTLAKQYSVDNIPTLLVFKNGELERTQVGQLADDELRLLLKDFSVFRESDDMREQARAKHLSGDTSAAILLLTEAIQKDPGNIRVALDMVQVFIDIGEQEQARQLFSRLSENHQHTDMGKALSGQLLFHDLAAKTAGLNQLSQAVLMNPDDSNARFDLAICQLARHDYQAAMDNLLHIQSLEPAYKEGAAREMMVTVINMLMPAEPEQAQEYRRRLSNLLAE